MAWTLPTSRKRDILLIGVVKPSNRYVPLQYYKGIIMIVLFRPFHYAWDGKCIKFVGISYYAGIYELAPVVIWEEGIMISGVRANNATSYFSKRDYQ